MYLSFFGLSRLPFDLIPRPESLFEIPSHVEATRNIIYGITEERGFIVITGNRGIGKTTVLNAATRSLAATHPSLIWAEFPDPRIVPSGVLSTLIDRLNLPTALTVDGNLGPIRNRLLRLRETGKSLVMVFDDAQDLPLETLVFLAKLAELENSDTPLFLIVFCGQPGFKALIDHPETRALTRRIAIDIVLSPITRQIARDYIRYRITEAGGIVDDVMANSAIRAVIRHAGGNPGRIHILAQNALLKGFSSNHQPITALDVNSALSDLDAGADDGTPIPRTRTIGILAGLGAIGGGAVILAFVLVMRRESLPLAPLPVVTSSEPTKPAIASKPYATAAPSSLFKIASSVPVSSPAATKPPPRQPAIPLPHKAPVTSPIFASTREAATGVVIHYRVKRGDSILSILRALSFVTSGVELHQIQLLNPHVANLSVIYPGQIILLPPRTPIHASAGQPIAAPP